MTESARHVRGPSRFKETDVARAIRAARKANIPIAAVKITQDGDILIISGTPEPVAVWAVNPLDDL